MRMLATVSTISAVFIVPLLLQPAPVFAKGDEDKPIEVTGTVGATVVEDLSTDVLGFSTAETDGDPNPGGVGGLSAICQTEFGPNARVCTSADVIRSPGISSADDGQIGSIEGWIQPVIASAGLIYDGSDFIAWRDDISDHGLADTDSDPSVARLKTTLSCGSWDSSASDRWGLVYREHSGITRDFCSNDNHVLCCGPAP